MSDSGKRTLYLRSSGSNCGTVELKVFLELANMGCSIVIGARVPNPAPTAKCVEFSRRLSVYPRVNPRVFQLDDLNEMMALISSARVDAGRMVVYFD